MTIRRTFDPGRSPSDEAGKSAVDAYSALRRAPDPLQLSAEANALLPFPFDAVWQVLLETQHLGTWLDDREYLDLALPERFGRGACINPGQGPTYLLDCDEAHGTKRLTFQRRFYADKQPFYYTVTIRPHERFSTKVSITVRSSERHHWFQASMMKLLNAEYPKIVRREL